MPDIIQALIQKQSEAPDRELCGAVLSDGRLVELPNEHAHPEVGFMISGKALDKLGSKLVGTWHTHPTTSAHLSQEDYLGFASWPGLIHYIAGTDGVRAYTSDDSGLVWETDIAPD